VYVLLVAAAASRPARPPRRRPDVAVHDRDVDQASRSAAVRAHHLLSLCLPAVLIAVAGVSVVLEAGGGLYRLVAGSVAGFVISVLNAWVLLVEIER
jgi:hypothetical protein